MMIWILRTSIALVYLGISYPQGVGAASDRLSERSTSMDDDVAVTNGDDCHLLVAIRG